MKRLEHPEATGAVAGILSAFRKSDLLEPADHPEDKAMKRVKNTVIQ